MAKSKSGRSARVDFDINAALALSDTLKNLPIEIQRDVLSEMVKEGSKPVVKSIKSMVPVDSGALKASIGAGFRKGKRGSNYAAAYVGPMYGKFIGARKLKKGESAEGSDQPARYAHLVEFGHVNRDGTTTPAKPYMRPGTEAAQNNCAAMKVVGFQKGMTRALAKLNKKNIRALSRT